MEGFGFPKVRGTFKGYSGGYRGCVGFRVLGFWLQYVGLRAWIPGLCSMDFRLTARIS